MKVVDFRTGVFFPIKGGCKFALVESKYVYFRNYNKNISKLQEFSGENGCAIVFNCVAELVHRAANKFEGCS